MVIWVIGRPKLGPSQVKARTEGEAQDLTTRLFAFRLGTGEEFEGVDQSKGRLEGGKRI